MKVRRCSLIVVCLVLVACAPLYSAEYDQNGILSLLKGDLNRDGFVDISDAVIVLSAWLEQDCGLSNQCVVADIYPECGDGAINFWDYDVLAGAWGSCTDPCDPCCTNVALTLYEPPTTAWVVPTEMVSLFYTVPVEMVSLFSGEFYKSVVDRRIPGSGIDFVFARTYRSRTGINTLVGNNWSHNNDIYIKACSGNIILHGPTGRRDIYYAQPYGKYVARGFPREISQNPDSSYTLMLPDTGKWNFNPLDGSFAEGKINSIVDRNDNRMIFGYDVFGRLVTIHTTLDSDLHNRDITLAYNSDGYLESVTDYTGWQVTYEYYGDGDPGGSPGDLKSVTKPAGKKTVYTYTKGFADDRLNHNILTETDPNGDIPLKYTYFGTQNPNDRDFDRVRRQILGGPNDIIDIRYRQCAPRAGNNYAVIVAIVNDRAGNVRHYWFDQYNRLVIQRQFTGRANQDEYTDLTHNRPVGKLRPDDPDFFETQYKYNEDHLPVRVDYPNGNYKVFVYQGDLEPNAPPRSRGNLREIHRFPGPLAPVSDQTEIVELFEYDPNSNHGTNFPTRYINGRGNERLYDHDNRGNLTRTTYKIPGPKPDIVVDYTCDIHGRPTSKLHPDNGSGWRRLDEYKYYDDPNDPNYGYLKNVIIDKNNHALTTTYGYDPVGKVILVTDPNGNDMQLIRNQLGQVVKQISRDVGGGLRYETDFHHDIKGNVVHVARQNIDEEGKSQANSYIDIFVEVDILNNPIRVTREVDLNRSISTEFEYDDNYNRTLIRRGEATNGNQPNNTVRTLFDERNRPFRITRAEGDPCQSTTQYDYDGNSNLRKVIKGLEGIPRITTHNHDGFNRQTETHDAMGNVDKFGYDDAGNMVSASRYGELLDVEGSAGNVRLFESKYRYDDLNRPFDNEMLYFDLNTQSPIGDGNSVTRFFYSDSGLLTKTIDDNNNPTRHVYDTAGRLSTIIDAKHNLRIFHYDENSNIIKRIDVDKSDVDDSNETFVTDFVRNGLGQVIRRIDSVGKVTEYGYNSQGKCTLITDALDNQIRFVYDDAGRLISTIRDMDGDGADPNDPNDIVTQAAYDDSGRCISFTDDNRNTTSSEYDALNRRIRTLYADGTENIFSYNVLDNVVQSVDGDGDLDVFIYDKLGRLTQKSITPGPETAPTTTFEEYKYDGGSRLVYAENNDSIVRFRYDSHSNLVEEILNEQKTSYTHDGAGNTLSCTYPGGREIVTFPDPLDLVRQVTEGPKILASYWYVGPRRKARVDLGNGTRTIYHYDGMKEKPNPPGDFGVKQITKTTHVRISDGSIIDERTYKWDPVGNKKQQKNIRPGGPQLTYDYLYDSAYRLIQTTVTDGTATVVRQTSYDLDGVGNRREVIGSPDTSPWVGSYIMDPTLPEPGDFQMNQPTSTPFDNRQYSKDGNPTCIDNGGTNFAIISDCHNQIVEYLNTGTGERHTYSYDALGRRFSKVVDADGIDDGPFETYYLYSGRQVVEERDGMDHIRATYVDSFLDTQNGLYDSPGDDEIIMTRGGQDYYYHKDDLGSIMAVTDNAGNAVERYRYADYGSPKIFNAQGELIGSSGVGNPYMFAGKHYDFETGLYNLTLDTTVWTKSFDPQSGRFIQRHGGDALGNHYTAFNNNPLSGAYDYGRDQAEDYLMTDVIISSLIALNRPSSGCPHLNSLWTSSGRPRIQTTSEEWFDLMPSSAGFSVAGGGGSGLVTGLDISALTAGFHVGGGGGSGLVSLGLDVDISPGSSVTDGIVVLQVNGGQSLLLPVQFDAKLELNGGQLPILGCDDADQDGDVDGDDFLIWQTELSGSRGDDVWLFGGAAGIVGPGINSYWQGEGLLRPKPESWDNADGDIDLAPPAGEDVLGLWGEVTWVGCLRAGEVPRLCGDLDALADIDIGGFYFYPVLNFTDFILGDGF